MDNPKNPYDPNVNQPQNTDQPKRSGSQETWPSKEQQGTGNREGQTDGDAQVGRRGGLDRNQDLNKENHEGEIPKSDPAQGEEPPFESRMPGEPPRDGENTTPDEN